MASQEKSSWNTLEVVKLFVSFLTPLLLFWIAYSVNESIRDGELRRQMSENEQLLSEKRQSAVQELSNFIYERRSRSELLSSALRRHAGDPTQQSLQEVIYRKQLYDDAYHNWNSNHQANLLLVRQILDSDTYTTFEAMVESRLVLQIFKPLDNCLTRAYDEAIRGRDPRPAMGKCNATDLIQNALDCGYAITDELFRISSSGERRRGVGISVGTRCPQPTP